MKNFLLFLSLLPAILIAQDLPKTNIFLFNYRQINDSSMVFYRPMMLTGDNANGYNNQPAFFEDDAIYMSSQVPGGNATDIFKLDPVSKVKYQVTNTSAAEYSPTLMPDGRNFSVVRQEEDGRQQLWKLPIDRSTNGSVIMPELTKVGYHFWLSPNELALFNVREGGKSDFAVANLQTGSVIKLASNVGRCFQKTASGNLAYVFKATEDTWIIQEMDIFTKKSTRLVKTLGKSEDFVVLPDGTFLTGHKSTIYKFHPAFDTEWLPVADFSFYGIKNISRMAVSKNNRLAVVSTD